MEHIKYKIGGLNVSIIKTKKFKTNNIVLNFRNYLSKEDVTKRALIPYILKSATERFPNKKAINQELETLYGASFGVAVNKQGVLQILSFRLSLVNDEYLAKNKTLLDDAFALLSEVIFKPKLENGVFSERVVNEEKRLLKEHFESIYDNKIRYSYQKLIDIMCKDEIFKLQAIGSSDDIDGMSVGNLYETYQKMIETDTLDLLFIGDVDEERIKNLITQHFNFTEREEIKEIIDYEDKEIKELVTETETQKVNQAKLNIGFRTFTRGKDADYYALLLLNAILGGYPHSLLFKNVREKASLCYYISSSIEKSKGLLVIYAGIDQNDYDKAIDIIFKQIEDIKAGRFSEEIIENSIRALNNDLLELMDSPIALLGTSYSYALYDEELDPEVIVQKLRAVKKEDIMKVAQKIKEDTIFLLKGEGDE